MSNEQRYGRNLGFLSLGEQEQIENSSIAIAGAGGDGGMLAVQLARLGVGEIKLADPDTFEIENINRQAVCTSRNLGTNKATAVANYIQDINPDISVEVYEDGVTEDNVAEFVTGTDLLIDETEFTMHELGVMLARESRKRNIPSLTALNMGFGAVVTTYHPQGVTLEERLGFNEDQAIDEIARTPVPLSRWLPYLPKYGDLNVLKKVAAGEKSAPSVAPGVAIAAGVASTQAFLNLVATSENQNHRPAPVYAPNAIVIDAMSVTAKQIKYNRTSYYRHLAHLIGRNMLRVNPKANY